MNDSSSTRPPAPPAPVAPAAECAPSPRQTLRQLFLTLFLRGRTSRGLHKKSAPKSVGRKLLLTLLFYAVFGLLALTFVRQSVFVLSVYLHAMTFIFLGMFVASSAGEVLFNREEADILLHRPVRSKDLLRAKVFVLVEISLWLAIAFNLVGFFVGLVARDGGALFLVAHLVSTVLEALFCTACVVMTYQLCLHWFGRERLDGLMTTTQVVVSIAAVLGGQLLPQFVMRGNRIEAAAATSWWIAILPPAWFAGLDDALAGSGAVRSWLLATMAVAATSFVMWIAFSKLARDYEVGLQLLNEAVSAGAQNRRSRRWLDALVDLLPLRWTLRDPVVRATFLLCAAYLVRDRDVRLRIYPGIAPIMVIPAVMLLQNNDHGGIGSSSFGIAFAGSYLGLVPLLGLSMLKYSQNWQASDLFRATPIPGPAPLCHGGRIAILSILALPVIAVFGLIVLLLQRDFTQLLLLLPGIVSMPIFALIPNLGGRAVPLSLPTDEAKSTGRGLVMVGVIPITLVLAGLTVWSWSMRWFAWFLLAETIVVIGLYAAMRRSLDSARWDESD
jgi:ABC-2 type transport system permease protein